MRILQLDRLRPGDVILETGAGKAADATGGPYGHAALAIGKLVKIEAGLGEGVVCRPFELSAYRRGDRRVVGVPITGDMVVMRRKREVDVGELQGRALLEAGRFYHIANALDLSDLSPEMRDKLTETLRGRRGVPDPEKRICSEVIAHILSLADRKVSPNGLATAPELDAIEDSITELENDWTIDPTDTATDVLAEKVSEIEPGLARRAMDRAIEAVAPVKRGEATVDEAADQLAAVFDEELRRSVGLMRDITKLEPTILHTGITPI